MDNSFAYFVAMVSFIEIAPKMQILVTMSS